ncbi:MAG: hemerythrin family protein [Bacteroidetes bacterium]|nr:hemerythrin family protein [Bacteroidota bacterium]
MKIIEWNDKYSVGIREIDDQHRTLVNTINKLLEDQRDEYDALKFKTALSSLIHYAYTHFATEEQYMLQAKFPDMDQHIMEHVEFIMKTLDLALKVENGKGESMKELLYYLEKWFSSHVLGTDRLYIPYITKNLK